MPPAEGEAATPAVEARAEVPEVAVEGEGKAAEAALPTEPTPPPTAEEASTIKAEELGKEGEVEPVVESPKENEIKDENQPAVAKAGEGEETSASTIKAKELEKESEVKPIVEAPKESETKDVENQPAVVKEDEVKSGEGEETNGVEEGEVKAAETATSAANLDNAANPPENVDKPETNATNVEKSAAEESASKEAAEPASAEPRLDLKDESVSGESKENEGDKKTEEVEAPITEKVNEEGVNNTSDASAEEPKEQEAPVETKEPEPEAQKNAAEGEATKEAGPDANAITQVQETEPIAQAETEKLPESLESSTKSNDTSVAETATGAEKLNPDAEKEKVESATNDAKESPTQDIAPTESQIVEQPKEVAAPSAQDHDYEDVTPLNSVADEVMLNTEYEDVTLLDSVVEESVVAPLEEKPQPAVPQPLGKAPEPVPKPEAPAPIPQAEANAAEPKPEAVVEGTPEEAPASATAEPTTDTLPVVSPRHKRNRDSFVETKEEIVDDLEFIKAKLATPPTAPAKGKRTSKEAAEIPEATKGTEEPERTKEVVGNVEKEKANETVSEEKAESKPEFARECIPPVRPQRSRTRPGARLSVPDWQPPKQTIFDYLISCFKPQAQ